MHGGCGAMTTHEIAFGFGYLGAALGVVMVFPQIVRIVRHPSLPGVSPISWALTVFGCLLWFTYGLRSGALPQLPGNLLLICGAIAVVLWLSARARRVSARSNGIRDPDPGRRISRVRHRHYLYLAAVV